MASRGIKAPPKVRPPVQTAAPAAPAVPVKKFKFRAGHYAMALTATAGTALGTYYFTTSHKIASTHGPDSDSGPVLDVFERLASSYDNAIGSEEMGMGYGLMRRYMMGQYAKGSVLEISAGTARNLPYYDLKQIDSLTICDLSVGMLQRGEDKFFDELRLADKYPDLPITFCVADAHCMTSSTGVASVQPLAVALLKAAEHQGNEESAPSRPGTARSWFKLPWSRSAARQESPASTANPSSSPDPSTPSPSPSAWYLPSAWWSRLGSLFPASASAPNATGTSTSSSSTTTATATSASSPAPYPQPLPVLPLEAPVALPPKHLRQYPTQASMFNFLKLFSTPAKSPPAPSSSSASGEAEGDGPCCSCHEAQHRFEDGYKERCRRGSTASGVPLAKFAPRSFDTVIDTFGLCSHENPVLVLKEAARVCKPDGRIILLEHGMSSYSWLNSKLEAGAQGHKHKWGCWWNRDIMAIVQEAGLEVMTSTTWHFGTTYLVVARPGLVNLQEQERLNLQAQGVIPPTSA